MYNATVEMPDLYLSRHIEHLGLNLTPKEHPIENKVCYWLHECNMDKVLPQDGK